MVLLVLLYALLASTFTIGKYTLDYGKPCFLIALRMLIAGVLLVGYTYWRLGTVRFIHSKKDYLLFFKTSLFHIYFAFVLEFWAMQYITSAKTNLFFSLTPFISALLAYYLLKEQLGITKSFGMILGFIGLCPVLFMRSEAEELTAEFFRISIPEVVLFFAVFSAAYAWFLVKKLMDRGYYLTDVNGIAMLVGGALTMITSIIVEMFIPFMRGEPIIMVTAWGPFLWGVLSLVMVSNIIAYNLYAWLFNYYSLTFISFVGFLCPIFGALFGWFFLGEIITWHYYVSFILVTIALFIFYKQEIAQKGIVS
jgi:drug/metabolite transporter (DMT)-like permease